MSENIDMARQALYRIDGEIASEDGMTIEHALTALEIEVDNLTRERDGYKGGRNNEYILRLEITKQNSALEGENAILRAALMWYGDMKNWTQYPNSLDLDFPALDDFGYRARSIIERLSDHDQKQVSQSSPNE